MHVVFNETLVVQYMISMNINKKSPHEVFGLTRFRISEIQIDEVPMYGYP